jgi:hypothetical protein
MGLRSEQSPTGTVDEVSTLREALGRAWREIQEAEPDEQARRRHIFSPSRFFHEWFRVKGTATYFLFKKNLRVTNLQFAELLSLIRLHIHGQPLANLHFASPGDYDAALVNLVTSFGEDDVERVNRVIAEQYGSLLRSTVVVRQFFGSAVVFTPPALTLDLNSICGYSGYIHSCGPLIYLRRIDKADEDQFISNLRQHLRTALGKRFFSVYAREDYKPTSRLEAEEARSGIGDVRLYVEKFVMKSRPLVRVINRIKTELDDKLYVPPPGNARSERRDFRRSSSTIWLLLESDSAAIGPDQPRDRYYVCYEQQLHNENPLHVLDESKPAWIAPVTIPHTMLGAMMNITRPGWPHGDVHIGDPFGGTGSTILESLKFPNVHARCADSEHIAPLLAHDNLAFFRFTREEFNDLYDHLSAFSKKNAKPEHRDRILNAYEWAKEQLAPYIDGSKDIRDVGFSAQDVATISERPLLDRLCLYLLLKANYRSLHGLMRRELGQGPNLAKYHAQYVQEAFERETRDLAESTKELARKLRRKRKVADGVTLTQGRYSDGCLIAIRSTSHYEYVVRDATELEADSYDVIITDPPYGFNTNEDAEKLAKLYGEMAVVLLKALRDGGQLVVALLERSHVGRFAPFFTHRELFTHQLLHAARDIGRDVYIPAAILPSHGDDYRPPYYWESERALRRSILHFHVRHARRQGSS